MAQSENELAEALMDEATVPELRDLCKRSGVTRERGASKAETVRALVDGAPEQVAEFLGVELEEPGVTLVCPCGLEEDFDALEPAVEAAGEHEAAGCGADLDGEGLGGLAVWDEETGAKAWDWERGYDDSIARRWRD